MREGLRIVAARGVTAVHDKDGWLGAPRFWQRLAEDGALSLRVWQSLPYDHVERLEEIGFRSGIGDDLLRIGYLKVFMDGTLGSQTARLLDGSGVADHESRATRRDRARRGPRRLAGRECTRSGISRTGRRSTRSRRLARIGPRSDFGRESSTRSSSPRRTSRASASSGSPPRFSSAMRRPIGTSRTGTGPGRRKAPTRTARCWTRAPWWRTDPTHRSRSWIRSQAFAPGYCAHSTSGRRGTRSRRSRSSRPSRRRSSRRRGSPAMSAAVGSCYPGSRGLVVLDRDPLAIASEELPELRGRRHDVGGRWIHNPPPWASFL